MNRFGGALGSVVRLMTKKFRKLPKLQNQSHFSKYLKKEEIQRFRPLDVPCFLLSDKIESDISVKLGNMEV